jgi:hypothetical protein
LHGGGDLARLDVQFGGDALYDLECYGFRHRVCVFLRNSIRAALKRRARRARGDRLLERGILP